MRGMYMGWVQFAPGLKPRPPAAIVACFWISSVSMEQNNNQLKAANYSHMATVRREPKNRDISSCIRLSSAALRHYIPIDCYRSSLSSPSGDVAAASLWDAEFFPIVVPITKSLMPIVRTRDTVASGSDENMSERGNKYSRLRTYSVSFWEPEEKELNSSRKKERIPS